MEFLVALFKIMVVNIVLSGDNAVVIALASRNLPQKQRWYAVFGGTAGAVFLRVILTVCAVFVLRIPFVQLVGGVLLVWIAVKLLVANEEDGEVHGHNDLWAAIRTIIVADIVMSLDNTLAIAAVAHDNIPLLVLGLLFSVPLIIFGSQIIMKVMEKHPVIVYVGAALIAWTAGEMIAGERKIVEVLPPVIDRIIPISLMGLVIVGCWLYNRYGPVGQRAEAAVAVEESDGYPRRR
jgi:YjbE family integral membrane protein